MALLKVILKLPLWWLVNIGAAFSQLVSAFFGGDPDETLSARLGKKRIRGVRWVEPFCRTLDFIHPDHCAKSAHWDRDEGGRSLYARFKQALETKNGRT